LKAQKIKHDSKYRADTKIRKKKKVKRNYFWVKFILFTIVFSISMIFIGLSSAFNITKIAVSGNKHYSDKSIIAATGIDLGSNGFKTIGSNACNLFSLRYGKSEEQLLKSFPYIKSVVVRFKLPQEVSVNIVERKPLGIVNCYGTRLIIDGYGYAVETNPKGRESNLPIINGLDVESFELGQALDFSNKDRLASAVKVINLISVMDKTASFKLYPLIDKIDVSDLSKVRVFFDSRLDVNFGDLYDLDYKLKFFREIFVGDLKEDGKGYLDMTLKNPSLSQHN